MRIILFALLLTLTACSFQPASDYEISDRPSGIFQSAEQNSAFIQCNHQDPLVRESAERLYACGEFRLTQSELEKYCGWARTKKAPIYRLHVEEMCPQ